MNSILNIIETVCAETHVPMVERVFGDAGVDAVFQIMQVAKDLYTHVEPERVAGTILIYRTIPVHGDTPAVPAGNIADFSLLANRDIQTLVVEVDSDGTPYLRGSHTKPIEGLATSAVVYRYSAGREQFRAGTQEKEVLRLDPSARSQFCVPTFSSLRLALEHYATDNVRESSCLIFQGVWHDDNRLFFRIKPEETMRRSMTQFLRNRLGAHLDVWPEQNVDESHPVDIRIQPRLSSNRLMLVEIKWLGDSSRPDGHVTVRYRGTRAQAGANQLAQYLDSQRRSAPRRIVHGYYVVVDGRRRSLEEGAAHISRVDGYHYEDMDLQFDPAHHEVRDDFDPPYRMFARPLCTT